MSATRWLDDREQAAWRALQRMQMHLDARLARQLAVESGLSYPDYVVLVALTDQPEGRLRLGELAGALAWEKSRASHHVARMTARGLVAKEPCDADRRGAWVVVTPEGRAEIGAAAPGHVRAVRELFVDRLTPEQLDAVRSAAEAVLEGLGCPLDAQPLT
jgi:DNA-binding MarR family transcriptional regulator